MVLAAREEVESTPERAGVPEMLLLRTLATLPYGAERSSDGEGAVAPGRLTRTRTLISKHLSC